MLNHYQTLHAKFLPWRQFHAEFLPWRHNKKKLSKEKQQHLFGKGLVVAGPKGALGRHLPWQDEEKCKLYFYNSKYKCCFYLLLYVNMHYEIYKLYSLPIDIHSPVDFHRQTGIFLSWGGGQRAPGMQPNNQS